MRIPNILACMFCVVVTAITAVSAAAQTGYWKKDHVYAGAGGPEIAIITPLPTDQTAPTAPLWPHSSANTSTSITLNWFAATDSGGSGIAGYKVYRQQGTGAVSLPVGTVGPTTGIFTDAPLQPATTYTYVIRAFDNAQNHSAPSTSVTVTTAAAIPDSQAPSVPHNVGGVGLSTTSIAVVWSPSVDIGASGIDFYRVFRNGVPVGTAAGTSFTDTGLLPNTTYTYTVSAVDRAPNESPQSSAAPLTTLRQLVFFDNFNRANGELVDSNWTYDWPSGMNWKIISNAAVAVYPPEGAGWTGPSWESSISAQTLGNFRASTLISLDTTPPSYGSRTGIFFWGTAGNPRYRAYLTDTGILKLAYYPVPAYELNLPDGTLLASANVPAGPCQLTVEANSATRQVKVYHNGLLKITFTESDTSRPNSGRIGITHYFGSPTTPGQTADDFTLEQ